MIDLSEPSSPHYFTIQNQESSDHRSDGTPPVSYRLPPRLEFKFPRHHPRRKALHDALEVLKIVADRDADYARTQNGEGFSKSDSSAGHMLSQSGLETALRTPQLADRILKMAGRYKRQVLRLRQMDLL